MNTSFTSIILWIIQTNTNLKEFPCLNSVKWYCYFRYEIGNYNLKKTKHDSENFRWYIHLTLIYWHKPMILSKSFKYIHCLFFVWRPNFNTILSKQCIHPSISFYWHMNIKYLWKPHSTLWIHNDKFNDSYNIVMLSKQWLSVSIKNM